MLGLPKERLAVTVFKGEDGIPRDEEAADEWVKAGIARERVYYLGKADNYWQMGDTGPQGPCSEIHYFTGDLSEPDMLSEARVAGSQGWLEIWNLVFMQFAKDSKDAPLVPLPRPSIDTGAGLERVAMVLQGKASTYDTDAFLPYIHALAQELGKDYGGFERDSADDVSMRVIADHARATAFLVADGVQPSNEGRGYVLRRIMRRAIRHGARLGYTEPFFHRACERVVERMKPAYPDMERARTLMDLSRRTNLGTHVCGGADCALKAAMIMGELLGWSAAEARDEAATLLRARIRSRLPALGAAGARSEGAVHAALRAMGKAS